MFRWRKIHFQTGPSCLRSKWSTPHNLHEWFGCPPKPNMNKFWTSIWENTVSTKTRELFKNYNCVVCAARRTKFVYLLKLGPTAIHAVMVAKTSPKSAPWNIIQFTNNKIYTTSLHTSHTWRHDETWIFQLRSPRPTWPVPASAVAVPHGLRRPLAMGDFPCWFGIFLGHLKIQTHQVMPSKPIFWRFSIISLHHLMSTSILNIAPLPSDHATKAPHAPRTFRQLSRGFVLKINIAWHWVASKENTFWSPYMLNLESTAHQFCKVQWFNVSFCADPQPMLKHLRNNSSALSRKPPFRSTAAPQPRNLRKPPGWGMKRGSFKLPNHLATVNVCWNHHSMPPSCLVGDVSNCFAVTWPLSSSQHIFFQFTTSIHIAQPPHISSHHISPLRITSNHMTSHHVDPAPSHHITSLYMTSHQNTSHHMASHHTSRHIELQTITWHDIARHDLTSHEITGHDIT